MKIDRIYLAGPMEDTPDLGAAWREEYARNIAELLDAHALSPVKIEDSMYRVDIPAEVATDLKKDNPLEFEKLLRRFVDLDLALIDMSDLVVVRWEGEGMCGTIAEVHHCYVTKKPVILVTSKEPHEVPGWMLAQIGYKNVFDSWECALGYIAELQRDTTEHYWG
tara:strand:- start:391 stop:885 length:495 start_codon:yes stop_codon:yes gene_type:complete